MGRTFYRRVATASALAVPISMVVAFASSDAYALEPGFKRSLAIGLSYLSLALEGGGFVAGLVAFTGISRYGTKGIRNKAICGTVFPALMFFMLIVALVEESKLMKKPGEESGDVATIAHEFNLAGAAKLGDRARLDNVQVMSKDSLAFNCTMINTSSADFQPKALEEMLRPGLLDLSRIDPKYAGIREQKITVVYRFKDEAGKEMGEVRISPEDLRN